MHTYVCRGIKYTSQYYIVITLHYTTLEAQCGKTVFSSTLLRIGHTAGSPNTRAVAKTGARDRCVMD